MGLDILVPQDLQRDVLALQFTVQSRPVRLEPPSLAALRSGRAIKADLQRRIGLIQRQRPDQAASSNRRNISRTVERDTPVRRAASLTVSPTYRTNLSISRTWRIATLSVGISLSQKERP